MNQPTGLLPEQGVVAGRTVLITGAGSGLGEVIARTFHAAGAKVILVGRTPEKLQRVADSLPGSRAATCDVSSPAAVEVLAAELAGERIDVLINNAGIGGPVAPITAIDPHEWDEVFAANVRSIYLMCRAFLPQMIDRGDGDVINLASVTGKRPLVRRTPYAASKLAVIGLTRTLAFELADSGVRVNTLSPGPVESERMARNFRLEAERTGVTIEAARDAFVSRSAMGRMVTPREVADAALAMLAIRGMTGADIDLSAGMIA